MPKVNPAFRDVLPPHTPEELQDLRAEIEAEGRVREPIQLWKDWIIDGHNRVEIAEELGVKYDVQIRTFKSEEEAKLWIIRNQLSRRNLTPDKASYLRGLLLNATPSRQGKRTDLEELRDQNVLKSKREKAEEIAENSGLSEKTVRRDGAYAKAVDALIPTLKTKALAGEIAKTDVAKLAKKTPTEQSQIARDVRVGKVPSVAVALGGKPKADIESSSIVLDAINRPVPTCFREAHANSAAIATEARKLDAILRKIRELAQDVGGEFIEISSLETQFKAIKGRIFDACYWSQCPKCQGEVGKKCAACLGRGWWPLAKKNKLSNADKKWLGID